MVSGVSATATAAAPAPWSLPPGAGAPPVVATRLAKSARKPDWRWTRSCSASAAASAFLQRATSFSSALTSSDLAASCVGVTHCVFTPTSRIVAGPVPSTLR